MRSNDPPCMRMGTRIERGRGGRKEEKYRGINLKLEWYYSRIVVLCYMHPLYCVRLSYTPLDVVPAVLTERRDTARVIPRGRTPLKRTEEVRGINSRGFTWGLGTETEANRVIGRGVTEILNLGTLSGISKLSCIEGGDERGERGPNDLGALTERLLCGERGGERDWPFNLGTLNERPSC